MFRVALCASTMKQLRGQRRPPAERVILSHRDKSAPDTAQLSTQDLRRVEDGDVVFAVDCDYVSDFESVLGLSVVYLEVVSPERLHVK